MKRKAVRKSKNTLTPLSKKLLIVLAVVVLSGVVIAVLNPGLTGNVAYRSSPSPSPFVAGLDAPSQQLIKLGLSRELVDGELGPKTLFGKRKVGDGRGIGLNPGTGKPMDNCPLAYNPNQKDSDGDGIGDSCDPKIKTTCAQLGKKDNDGDNLCTGDKDEPNDNVFNYLKSVNALPSATGTPPPAVAARPSGSVSPRIA